MTAKDILKKSVEDGGFFAKYVSTESGYYFGPHFMNHGQLVPNGEKPITAGFISVVNGEVCKLMREGSMTLQVYPDPQLDVAGLSKAFGIRVIRME